MDLVYKTTTLTQGGRGGQVQSVDGSFKLKLAVPKEMGGSGEGPNPEMLFAAAFAGHLPLRRRDQDPYESQPEGGTGYTGDRMSSERFRLLGGGQA